MSDDQMRGLKDLLRSENGEAPPDDTSPTARSTGRGRGLSALAAAARPSPAPQADAPSPSERRPPTAAPTSAVTTTRPASRPPSTEAVAPTPDQAATPRRKTSVTLPPSVRDRVAEAYHQSRWTLLALLEMAGERLSMGEIARSDVEAAVTALADGGGSASIRSLSVPTALLEQFDDHCGAWRLSRSALLAACLMLILDDLPE